MLCAAQIGLDAYFKFVAIYLVPPQPAIGPSDPLELENALIVNNKDACLQFHRFDLRVLVGVALSPFGLAYFGNFQDFLSSDLRIEFIIFQLCGGGLNSPPGKYYTGELIQYKLTCLSKALDKYCMPVARIELDRLGRHLAADHLLKGIVYCHQAPLVFINYAPDPNIFVVTVSGKSCDCIPSQCVWQSDLNVIYCVCPAGFFCTGGRAEPQSCLPGSFAPAGAHAAPMQILPA